MGDITTTVRRIECDGCGASEETEDWLGQPTETWTRVAIEQVLRVRSSGEHTCESVWHRTLCEVCADKLIGKLDDLKAEAGRLKGGKAPRGWP